MKSMWNDHKPVCQGMVALILGSCISCNSTATNVSRDKTDAWVMAQQFVKRELKSPATADFGSPFSDYQDPKEVVQELGDGKFLVKGWVDAKNSFGATIRTSFICELQYAGKDNWHCTMIELNE